MIRTATDGDYQDIHALWKKAFPGNDDFDAYYFSNIYSSHRTICDIEDGRTAAMLQMLDCTLRCREGEVACGYIYGAATDIGFRRQGRMKQLIGYAHRIMKSEGKAASVLIPQSQGELFRYYEKLGYTTLFFSDEQKIEQVNTNLVYEHGEERIADLNRLYEIHMDGRTYASRSKKNWTDIVNEAKICGGGALFCRSSYIIYEREGDEIFVSEAIGEDSVELAQNHAARTGAKSGVLRTPAQRKNGIPAGCIKTLGNIGIKAFKSEPPAYLALMHS